MHDRAAVLRAIDQREVFLDAVEGFHLEAPPVGPQRAAHAFGGKPVGDLVGLDAVVERGDLEAELLGQVEHRRHLVGAVAVDVHLDVAVERAGERVELEVALAAAVLVGVGLVAASGLFFFRYSAASMNAARYPATLPMRVAGPPFCPYTRFGFSPQAIFRPHGAPGNFIAW